MKQMKKLSRLGSWTPKRFLLHNLLQHLNTWDIYVHFIDRMIEVIMR